MQTIEIKTLIDITNTDVIRHRPENDKEFNQQKNWITLLQCIGLRSIIEYENPALCDTVDVKDLQFGSKYKGKHKVWTFKFTTDRMNSFLSDDDDPLGLLTPDLHQVPVIKNLEESINISKAVFDLSDAEYKNTTIALL
jgi:hypothetical protein